MGGVLDGEPLPSNVAEAGPGHEVVYVVVFLASQYGFLCLYRSVGDTEVVMGEVLDAPQELIPVSGVVGIYEHMGGEGDHSGGDCPDVDVMDESNARDVLDVAAELVDIQVFWGAFQQDVDYPANQAPGAVQD